MENSSSTNLKVSVIVPVYNTELYLKRCIESILNQTHENIEIILVNDGSTDLSGNICDSFRDNNKIIVEHISNRGAGGARNVGLDLATGDFISFVDSDDWIHPEMLNAMLYIAIKEGVQLVECNLKRVKQPIKYEQLEKNKFVKIELKDDALERIIRTQRFSTVIRLYKKNLVSDLRFKEKLMAEDVYFTFRIINRIDKLARVPYTLYYYFANNDSVSKSPYSLKKLDTLKSALYIKREINKEDNAMFNEVTRKFVLDTLLYNYKGLHANTMVDPKRKYRKYIKGLMQENFTINELLNPVALAVILPIFIYGTLISLNSIFK